MKWLSSIILSYPLPLVLAYDPTARWGQAIAVINNVIYVHGGKIDPSNSYSYSGAPVTSDLLSLSLTSPFQVASPPWKLLEASRNSEAVQSPNVAWHTLSVLNSSHILLFGGQPGPQSSTALSGSTDSVRLIDTTDNSKPEWIYEDASWARQPERRIHHSTATDHFGRVYIVGGERADGSDNIFSQHYVFHPQLPSFDPLPFQNGPPDIFGHASVMLPDGRLLVFGGYSQSLGSLVPLSTIWVLNTTQTLPTWALLRISSFSLPRPRRSFAAAVLNNGYVLIQGGSDTLQNIFADGWILDTSQPEMIWQQRESLSQLGPRRDHFAASSGNQVIFDFGYSDNSPAVPSVQVYDYIEDTFKPTYVPPPLSSINPVTSATSSPSYVSPSYSPTTSSTDTAQPTGGPPGGRKKRSVAIGVIFGVPGLIIIAVLIARYFWRKRLATSRRGNFVALGQGDDDGSLHVAGGPIVVSLQDGPYHEKELSWNSRIFKTLSSIIGVGSFGKLRDVPARRDMLADEDSWEFGAWHARVRKHRTSGSSWSFRNIFTPGRVSREISFSGIQVTGSRVEERNNSPTASVQLEGAESSRPADFSTSSERSRRLHSDSNPYVDPFTDPPDKMLLPGQETGLDVARPIQPHLQLSPQATTTMLGFTHRERTLSTLSEHTSHGDASSQLTAHSSNRSQTGLIPSNTGNTISPVIRRSDSWWARLSRTGFIDRRLSNATQTPRGMLEFRDPNPPPRFLDENAPEPSNYAHKPRVLSAVYESHSKSRTSVGTAESEVLEKMARNADVQIVRSGSQATTSTHTTAGRHMRNHSDSVLRDGVEGIHHVIRSTSAFPLQSQESIDLPPTFQRSSPEPSVVTSTSGLQTYHASPHTTQADFRVSGQLVNARREESSNRFLTPITYGLTSRPSLYVANPDHKITSSGQT